MGGHGSGGARPGSGNKGERDVALDGPLPEVEAPPFLRKRERKIWDFLAPHAIARRTLTPAEAFAFGLLCQQIVQEQRLGRSRKDRGGPAHAKFISLVRTGMRDFRIEPMGKPIATPASTDKPKSALEQLQANRPALHAVK